MIELLWTVGTVLLVVVLFPVALAILLGLLYLAVLVGLILSSAILQGAAFAGNVADTIRRQIERGPRR